MTQFTVSRRQMLEGAAAFGALSSFGGAALAQEPSRWPAVTRLIGRYVEQRKVANMVAALGFGEAPPAFLSTGLDSFGQPRKANADSIYRIYSMTKPVTGMATAQLIAEGKLGLDQPLHEILPKFRTMRVQKRYDGPLSADNLEAAARPITIRHLLTHTSGLGYSLVQQGPLGQAFRDRGLVPGVVTRLQYLPVFRGTAVRGLETFADRLAEMPLVYQPGTRWSYSMGADLLGRVIEVVSGQKFDRFLQDRLFDPLGMSDTHFHVPRSKAERMTTSYFLLGSALLPIDVGRDSVFFDEPAFPFGGAGLASTPRDYDKFLRMLLGYGRFEGKSVLSEAAVRLGTSDLLPSTLTGKDEHGTTWGFGALGRVGRGDQAGIYGWAGAAGTLGFVDMKRQLRAGLFTQYMPQMEYPLIDEFPKAILADLAAQERA
jgi:CubicO group peptidase (beta-lactamase class C family)